MRQPVTGSSPRVRGTPWVSISSYSRVRFIPARAGNTELTGTKLYIKAVHPRACGEHEIAKQRANGLSGSSPRVRGTLAEYNRDIATKRFIPARAGNTPPVP